MGAGMLAVDKRNFPSVPTHDLLDQIKPKSGSSAISGTSLESFEDPILILFRHAWPLIHNVDLAPRAYNYRYLPTATTIVNGVLHKVSDCTLNGLSIYSRRSTVRSRFEGDLIASRES